MRTFAFWFIIFFLFLFIFFKSNTWEVHHTVEKKYEMEGDGIDYNVTKHSIHWDRFFDYIINIPKEIQRVIFHK